MSSLANQRYQIIDVLRGSAIALMFIYHFCYDIHYFGHVTIQFNTDPFWISFRTLIVSLFLSVVGISLQVAHARHWQTRSFFKRLGWLAGAASLVSLSSYIMFPNSLIWFGILHFILVASVLGLLFLKLYWLNLVLGVSVILTYLNFQHPVFDLTALQWLGLGTFAPKTEDYVPIFPWFGVVLIGLFLGRYFFLRVSHESAKGDSLGPDSLGSWHSPHPVFTTLALAGQHSLIIYLIHQPIFMGLIYVVTELLRA